MSEEKTRSPNRLVERMVRNDNIFCSLLFNSHSGTLRVVDFRGGNFATKHGYLEDVLKNEGMRKIFTLTERDDMNGWQRVGYQREGNIPGYYKRSDAYIMSRIYDEDYAADSSTSEDAPERKNFLQEVRNQAKDVAEQKVTGVKLEPVGPDEALEAITDEVQRCEKKSKKSKRSKSKIKVPPIGPIFSQFSREVEYFYFVAQNRRTKQVNVFGAEYQDCFSNAKVDVYFSPDSRADMNLARSGLLASIDRLDAVGVVSLFATVPESDLKLNVLFAACGFRNTGWMNRHVINDDGPQDLIIWSRKLI